MTRYGTQPDSGERRDAKVELEDGQLDQVVGGEAKKTETKKDDRKSKSADYLVIKLTNVTLPSY